MKPVFLEMLQAMVEAAGPTPSLSDVRLDFTCPVSMMQKYFSMAGLSHTSDKLFRAIVYTRNGECLRRGGGLSYRHLRELLLAKIEQLGMDHKLYA